MIKYLMVCTHKKRSDPDFEILEMQRKDMNLFNQMGIYNLNLHECRIHFAKICISNYIYMN